MTTDKIIIYVFAVIIYILIAINFWLNHKWSQSEKRVNRLSHDLSNAWLELSMYHRLQRKQPYSKKDRYKSYEQSIDQN